jgi:polyhydroxybutyrate depolymerase
VPADVPADLPPADEGPADVWSFDVTIPETLGGDRPAQLVVPAGYRPDRAWPLVVLLHGYGVSGYIQDLLMQLAPRVDSHGFVLLLPDGTVDEEGYGFWNAWPPCCNFFGSDVDDVAYLRGLIEEAQATLHIDPDRVFLVGHSNGGFMSTRMACEVSDLVTGIAPIAGSMSLAPAECTPSRPVSVLVIHGTKDTDIRYEGGSIGGFPYVGAEALTEFWRGVDGCTPTQVFSEAVDYDVGVEGAETTGTSWPECADGTRVAHWKMTDSGHAPGFTDAFRDALVAWLLGNPRAPAKAPGLPDALAVPFSRPDAGTPVPDADTQAFTRKVLRFLRDVHYFDYVLYTTHGVDASTGLPDWQFWYNERFRKEGDLVTFYHPVNLNDGGHNLHIPFSHVLSQVLATYLLIGDPTAALAAEKLCKGLSASMLGMVRDADDPLPHLMARNVVAFNHAFDTHDGKRKAIDVSGWFSDYTRWNCDRFQYADNPYWGPMWVTNMRSKDDVPHLFRMMPSLRYAAAQAPDAPVQEACGQALELMEAFAKDIVDSDYRIRTKDAEGNPYMPGFTGDADLDAQQGDLASFIHWRDVIPEGECNARRGAELIGYHRPVREECGRGEPNAYDDIAFVGNAYNKRICRYFHLAHLGNALANRDDAAAELLLEGLDERMAEERAMPEKDMQATPEKWSRDLAVYLADAATFGYPLDWDDVRRIHKHYGRAVDEMSSWPYWDPWAESVPDGELGGYRPPSCAAEQAECWFGVEDLALVFETCWSPLRNPAGRPYVDCDIVRDPSKWDEPR